MAEGYEPKYIDGGAFKIIQTTMPSSTGRHVIYSDASLLGNYIVIGYSIKMGSTYYTWWYNDVIKSLDISSSGISVEFSNSAVANYYIYIVLARI